MPAEYEFLRSFLRVLVFSRLMCGKSITQRGKDRVAVTSEAHIVGPNLQATM
jgi:hypothetical protein